MGQHWSSGVPQSVTKCKILLAQAFLAYPMNGVFFQAIDIDSCIFQWLLQ